MSQVSPFNYFYFYLKCFFRIDLLYNSFNHLILVYIFISVILVYIFISVAF